MSHGQIKTNLENGDLSRDMRKANGDKLFDFRTKEMKEIMKEKPKLEPITFGGLSFTLNDMLNLVKFTELLKENKKD